MGIKGSVLKSLYKKPTVNIIQNHERRNSFLLRLQKRQGLRISQLLFNIVLRILVDEINKEKNKSMQITME